MTLFTTKFASMGIAIHGTAGSLIATDGMTQRAIGEVVLQTAEGDERLPIDRGNLHEKGLVRFAEAIAGRGEPSASGEDGPISLATALAALESGRSGKSVPIVL